MTMRVLSGTSSPMMMSTKSIFVVPALIGNVSVSPILDVGPPTPAVRKATTSVVGGDVEIVKPTSILDSRALPTLVTEALICCVEPVRACMSIIEPLSSGKWMLPVIISTES